MSYLVTTKCHCNTLQHTCNTLRRTATHCRHTATHRDTQNQKICNKLHRWALRIIGGLSWNHTVSLEHTAPHCITLQRTATRCNTLQRTATHVQLSKVLCMKNKRELYINSTKHTSVYVKRDLRLLLLEMEDFSIFATYSRGLYTWGKETYIREKRDLYKGSI